MLPLCLQPGSWPVLMVPLVAVLLVGKLIVKNDNLYFQESWTGQVIIRACKCLMKRKPVRISEDASG